MSLEISDTFNGLRVCAKCGWPMAGPYEEQRHATKCEYVREGSVANELAYRLPEIASTKFGYGTGVLVFDIADDFNIRFRPDRKGGFSLADVFMLRTLTPDQAEALIRALAAWWKSISK